MSEIVSNIVKTLLQAVIVFVALLIIEKGIKSIGSVVKKAFSRKQKHLKVVKAAK